MAAKFFIQEHLHKKVAHGSIGNVDAEKILMRNGYKAIVFPCIYDFSLKAKLQRLMYLVKTYFRVKAADILVFQFPLHAKMHYLLINLLRLKGAHIICFIADIEGMRIGDNNRLEKEKKTLLQFFFFIVHNAQMDQWLRSIVPHAITAEIEFFDFLATPAVIKREKDYKVLFAGNLQKSEFVQNLESLHTIHPALQFLLYGPYYPEQAPIPSNAIFKGVFDPYELVQHAEGSFGLIWDGTSIETCTGSYGKYLAYNSPHKLSFYILCGIPIIAPNMSASARLIEKYGIGCTVERLSDIEVVIKNINIDDYHSMVQNMTKLAAKISGGKCLEEALETLVAQTGE